MDIPWGSEAAKKFITNVGLITSNGPFGHNRYIPHIIETAKKNE